MYIHIRLHVLFFTLTGLDVTPWPPAQDYEIHVTGDVALALRQYMEVTGDDAMLHEPLFRETVFAIADFWKSRATLDASRGLYEIHSWYIFVIFCLSRITLGLNI